MNPLRTFITPIQKRQGPFWVEKVVLHHIMPSNDLHSFTLSDNCFLSYYHRQIQVFDKDGFKECLPGTLIAWSKGSAITHGHREQEWENSYIIFGGPLAEEFLLHFPCNEALATSDQKMIMENYEAILNELSAYDPYDIHIIQNLIDNLLRLIKRDSGIGNSNQKIPSAYLKAKQFISDHYPEAIQIPELANRVGVSVAHFSKRFKHYFNSSPSDHLISVRMEQAAYLMKDPNLTVTAIAQMVGYDNIHYFSRVVKKYYGSSPRELRRENR